MSKRPITRTSVEKLKKEAKALCKATPGLSLQQVQNMLAEREGFRHWNELKKHTEASPAPSVELCDAHVRLYYESLPVLVFEQILKNYHVSKLEVSPEAELLYRRVWGGGFDERPSAEDAGQLHFTRQFHTENIKEIGYEMIRQNESISPLVEAAVWVAAGHFWRSVNYALQDRRQVHAGFKRYMQDWVASLADSILEGKDKCVLDTLRGLYPLPDVLMMLPGATIWGSINGQPYEGRPSKAS